MKKNEQRKFPFYALKSDIVECIHRHYILNDFANEAKTLKRLLKL